MKQKNKKAFSLIEIIIASSILSITVFWVYKLISENYKLINNSENYLQINNLFLVFQECIKNKNYTTFSGDILNKKRKFNFWTDLKWCEIVTSSWVILNNIEYYLTSETTGTWINYIDFELKIEWDWIWIESKNFRLYK